jgi:hypothetical protein
LAAREHDEKASFEDQLARWLKEKDVLRQQMNEMSHPRAEQSNLDGDLEDTAKWTDKDKVRLDKQLASCQEESESLRQLVMKVEAA